MNQLSEEQQLKEKGRDHRASCHRCGNIRKHVQLCTNCPHVFCNKCVAKVMEEYSSECFDGGCPVCKKLCCCSCKTRYCQKKYHCYKKCPATRIMLGSTTKKVDEPFQEADRLDLKGYFGFPISENECVPLSERSSKRTLDNEEDKISVRMKSPKVTHRNPDPLTELIFGNYLLSNEKEKSFTPINVGPFYFHSSFDSSIKASSLEQLYISRQQLYSNKSMRGTPKGTKLRYVGKPSIQRLYKEDYQFSCNSCENGSNSIQLSMYDQHMEGVRKLDSVSSGFSNFLHSQDVHSCHDDCFPWFPERDDNRFSYLDYAHDPSAMPSDLPSIFPLDFAEEEINFDMGLDS